jgi:hypothetical protein
MTRVVLPLTFQPAEIQTEILVSTLDGMAVMHLGCVSEAERVMQWRSRQEGWDWWRRSM